MTASLLLLYICAALFLQLAVGGGVAVWRLRRIAPGTAVGPGEGRPETIGDAWPGWREFRVARRNIEDAGATQCSFHLMAVDGGMLPPFKPGQFLTVRLHVANPGTGIPGGSAMVTRCYSLSDRPRPEAYRITVKRVVAPPDRATVPPGGASAHLLDRVRENDVIEIRCPAGQFFLDPDPLIPAVLISGGIGITPMMSILHWCLDEQPDRVIYLFHGVRNGREHAFKATLEELAASHRNFHLSIVYSRPNPDDVQGRDFQHTGHVDVDLLRRILPRGKQGFYVCGPPAMMESLVPALRAWGIADEDIHFEAFGPASVRSTIGASPEAVLVGEDQLEIAFRRSGRTLRWDGRDASLLAFAERHGVPIDTGCRSGSCGSCETRLLAGRVQYPQKPDHVITAGTCLLCVGTPASHLLLDA